MLDADELYSGIQRCPWMATALSMWTSRLVGELNIKICSYKCRNLICHFGFQVYVWLCELNPPCYAFIIILDVTSVKAVWHWSKVSAAIADIWHDLAKSILTFNSYILCHVTRMSKVTFLELYVFPFDMLQVITAALLNSSIQLCQRQLEKSESRQMIYHP